MRIVIDDKIRIEYNHYKYDENIATPTVINQEIYYNKIEDYVISKYKSRLSKMTDKPIFVIGTSNPARYYSEDEIRKICKLCEGKYKLIVANNLDLSSEFPTVKFITSKPPKSMNINDYAIQIYPEIEQFIKEG